MSSVTVSPKFQVVIPSTLHVEDEQDVDGTRRKLLILLKDGTTRRADFKFH
ncbi:MAG: hypothetical protein ACR2G6_06390 [Gemmatimonadaceae bacterium]